ncbi:MAG: phenylalanine--tRNA ligase subunit alpha [Clostridia bacterium]|nr:phenylalanine--tRNA ligase subunit alpha [Clostridia bacterium]
MEEKLLQIKENAIKEIKNINNLEQLNAFRVKYAGKQGALTEVMREMREVSQEDRPKIGVLVNEVRTFIEGSISNIETKLNAEVINAKLVNEKIDVTLDKPCRQRGSLHPITIDLMRMSEILNGLGFSQIDGPEMEYDKYNFELVNIPKDHPTRDMQDTYFITNDILLRTQTSNTQPRAMENIKPPFKVYSMGRVFRKDEIDATHTPAFYQVEGIYIDEKVSMADLKNTIEIILKKYLGNDSKTRFRASFFPFTEPSVEVDATCNICNGKGCSACKNTGGYEILGAGMIHPKVLELNGIDSKKYSGFAFGFGFDRFPKMRYKIPFARMMFEHDVRFLRQFK